jgi:hypothetical protein
MPNLPQPPKVINPLWIISFFFSFTEIALGYVVFKTTGGIQVSLTCFVIGFPILVATAFFALLWFRPEHLYAPKDFGSDESFLRSIADARKSRQGLLNLDAEIERRISANLTSDQLLTRISPLEGYQLKEALKDAAVDISNEIREATSISISLTSIAPELNDLIFPVDAFATFSDLTDQLYFALDDYVEPYTYGTSWILRDKASGKIFKNARMIAGIKPGKIVTDFRTLEEVGIKAGMSLEVIPPEK